MSNSISGINSKIAPNSGKTNSTNGNGGNDGITDNQLPSDGHSKSAEPHAEGNAYDLAGAGSLFPGYTNFTNEKAAKLVDNWRANATGNTADLADVLLSGDTTKISEALQVAAAEQEAALFSGDINHRYITYDEKIGTYYIDTNQDGNAETEFTPDADCFVKISDEYGLSESDVLHHKTNVCINYDDGSYLGEYHYSPGDVEMVLRTVTDDDRYYSDMHFTHDEYGNVTGTKVTLED